MSTTKTTQCGCCLVPVDDETEACDLCSEATGMHDGTGWKIQQCTLHAAAHDLLAACKALLGKDMPAGGQPGHIDYAQAVSMAEAAIAKAEST